MNFPVFDLHCDTSDRLAGIGCDTYEELKKNQAHIDLERAGKLGGYAQCFACFTNPDETRNPVDTFEKKFASILREISKNESVICQAFNAEEIVHNKNGGIMSAILTIEGPAGFGYDPELLEDLYKVGFRMSTLGHNEKSPLSGSHFSGGGLTEQGREYVRQAQNVVMIIDVSHISDEGFWDIMNITNAPVVASHSNSRSICNVSRNLTDDMFLAICKTGGVAGVNLYTEFLGPNADLDTVCNHIFHFMELDPSGKHIALGGDLDGCNKLPQNFTGIDCYNDLANRLIDRGLDQAIVQNIFWDNALEVFRKCCI